MHTELGLRERKKAATRRALGSAAMRLAMEHGVANVSAEAIATEADVSPRTFHNYFSSKEEAIVSVVGDRAAALIEAVRNRPEGEPIWDSLEQAVLGLLDGSGADDESGVDEDQFLDQLTFIHDNAVLLMQEMGALKELGERLAEVIAQRTGTDMNRDLYPRLQASAAAVCLGVAQETWISDPANRSFPDLIKQGFAQMRTGLPQPGTQL